MHAELICQQAVASLHGHAAGSKQTVCAPGALTDGVSMFDCT